MPLAQHSDVIPTEQESSLGLFEYQAVVSSVQDITNKKRENIKLTDKERYDIGKYSSIHGATATVRKFKKSHPHLKLAESTASLKKKYEELLKSKSEKMELTKLKCGRPLMLGSIDERVKNFLLILSRKGGVVAKLLNSVVAIAATQALIQKSSDEHVRCIDLVSSSWTQSLFRRIVFVRRLRTTDKPEIPDQAVKEAKLLFQHQIVSIVEDDEIPESLIMNFYTTEICTCFKQYSRQKRIKTYSNHGWCLQRINHGDFWHHIFGQVFANATNM